MNNVAEIDLILFSLGTAKLIWELKVEALRTETRRPFFCVYRIHISHQHRFASVGNRKDLVRL